MTKCHNESSSTPYSATIPSEVTMAQRCQQDMPVSSSSSHLSDGDGVSARIDPCADNIAAPIRTQTHGLLRFMITSIPSSSATQPRATNGYAGENASHMQRVLESPLNTQANHDRAVRTEQRLRNIAPFETPSDSPSFRSIPLNLPQPEIRGEGDRIANTSVISPAPWMPQNPIPSAGSQDHLVEAAIERRRISELMTSIPAPRNFIPSDMVQQRDLADDLNCALFLRNIPMSASLSGFFDMVDTGAVYALHIMPPNGQHHTCAAKLTFMEPEGAAIFLAKARHGIRVAGYLLDARYNIREGYLRNTTAISRVIHVEGPEAMMTVDYWFRYFRQVCVFQWDRVVALACPRPGRKFLEFRFACINGQAQTCLQEIQQQEEFAGLVDVAYGFDPCGQPTLRDMAPRRSQMEKEFGFRMQ
ncbi:uncharacterized protein PAC_12208 [Phialocephala subalpina]|uniref:RRM domain-containing protein n=1 Tax=Phialocephala subalpina TaxID=576137 RepID=A0A1L7XBB2_9HELO|nr:uncharacterized protein PAC_12208 [Phialocephala subalpina]